jgi:hypothetical protein
VTGSRTAAGTLATVRQIAARSLPHAGVDPRRLARTVIDTPRFLRDLRTFRARAVAQGEAVPALRDLFPILTDRTDESGAARGHYFHQDLWAARKVHAMRPSEHFDIGSRIDGFIASLVVFQSVTVIDVRPLPVEIENLRFVQADATDLRFLADRSVASISSLHAVEHFGLGRYGDPIDPGAWRTAIGELVRVSAPGGRVYFSTPIGRERLLFNAHRVFAPETVLSAFSGLELVSFAAVNDAGDYVHDPDPSDFRTADYSCGLFEFTRASGPGD